jgi:hypothetical protein
MLGKGLPGSCVGGLLNNGIAKLFAIALQPTYNEPQNLVSEVSFRHTSGNSCLRIFNYRFSGLKQFSWLNCW